MKIKVKKTADVERSFTFLVSSVNRRNNPYILGLSNTDLLHYYNGDNSFLALIIHTLKRTGDKGGIISYCNNIVIASKLNGNITISDGLIKKWKENTPYLSLEFYHDYYYKGEESTGSVTMHMKDAVAPNNFSSAGFLNAVLTDFDFSL